MKKLIDSLKRFVDAIFVNPHESKLEKIPVRVERKRPPFNR